MLTVGEVRALLHHLDGAEALVAQLLYGGGRRLMEALHLRIKDEDLEQRCITVRCGKGDKDRRTVLPSSLVDPLKRHMKEVQHQHQTPLRHSGSATAICQQRALVYEAARRANPTRSSGATRCWSQPAEVLINKPTEEPDPLLALPLIKAA